MQIETLELLTADVAAQYAFYAETLGLPVTREATRLTVFAGASQLIFREQRGFRGVYHFAFNVPENRLDAAKSYLEARGIHLLPDDAGQTVFDFHFWDAHALYFLDAAGNIAEFIARHELPNALENPEAADFSVVEILNISEIGLPAENVPALAATLSHETGLVGYRDTSTSFHPLGDADGLLILVPLGRVWYPGTGISAEALPVRAIVRTDANTLSQIEGSPYHVAR